MIYKIVSTDEMDKRLDKCILYLVENFQNKQAASHLLDEITKIYGELERNPFAFRVSNDPLMKKLNYHEAKIPEIIKRKIVLIGRFIWLYNFFILSRLI